MAERIEQRLPADPINLIPKHGMQGPAFTIDNHAKVDFPSRLLGSDKLLLDAGERLLEIERGALRRAQAANGVAAFVDHLTHQFQRPGERRLDDGIRGQAGRPRHAPASRR